MSWLEWLATASLFGFTTAHRRSATPFCLPMGDRKQDREQLQSVLVSRNNGCDSVTSCRVSLPSSLATTSKSIIRFLSEDFRPTYPTYTAIDHLLFVIKRLRWRGREPSHPCSFLSTKNHATRTHLMPCVETFHKETCEVRRAQTKDGLDLTMLSFYATSSHTRQTLHRY